MSEDQQHYDSFPDVHQDEAEVTGNRSATVNSEPTVSTYEPGRIYDFDLDDLHSNPGQPRQFFDVNEQRRMELSVASTGVKIPIMVRQDSAGRLIIVDGECRWRASKKAHLKTIPGILAGGDAQDMALIANVVRQNLQPMDEAEAVHKLIEQGGCSRDEIMKMLGKSESSLSEILALNKLPEVIKVASRGNPNVSRRLLLTLVRANVTPEEQVKLFQRAQQFGWTSEQLWITLAEKKAESVTAGVKFLPFLTKRLAEVRPEALNRAEKDALKHELDQCKRAIEVTIDTLG